jgi:ERCC4-type nuclease
MSLKIDHREAKCKEYFEEWNKEKQYSLILENLTIGDFQIIKTINNASDNAGDNASDCTSDEREKEEILFCFERKTLADLIASIKDGRYKNQKAKCLSQLQHTQLYYIIEGKCSYSIQPKLQKDKIIHSAIINTMLRDKIGCFFTKDAHETFELIGSIFTRYMEDPEKYKIQTQPIETQMIVETKSTNTPQDIYKKMLCQIPSINDKSALAIIDKYPSFTQLIEQLKPLSPEERIKELNTIKVNSRKISKRIVEECCRVLF